MLPALVLLAIATYTICKGCIIIYNYGNIMKLEILQGYNFHTLYKLIKYELYDKKHKASGMSCFYEKYALKHL